MRKKLLKYAFVTVIIIVLLRFLFSFELVKTADRGGYAHLLSADMKEQIANDTKGFTEEEIIKYSTKQTASQYLQYAKINSFLFLGRVCEGSRFRRGSTTRQNSVF